MIPSSAVRIFVATQPVDFRGSFDRLAGYVRERLGADPRSGALFVFVNRSGDRLKLLFFDQTGDCLFYKRLDRGTFHGVIAFETEGGSVEIDRARLVELLRGQLGAKCSKLH